MRREFRDLFLDNPLLRHRLERSTVYTFENVALLLLLAGMYLSALLLCVPWLQARKYLAAVPAELRTAEAYRLNLVEWDADAGVSECGAAYPGPPSLAERAAPVLQFVFLTWLLAMLNVSPQLHFQLPNQLWRNPRSSEMRLLPVSPAQLLVAHMDWPFLKTAVAILLAIPALFGPRRVPPATPFYQLISDALVTPEFLLAFTLQGIAVCYGIHRLRQLSKHPAGLALQAHRSYGLAIFFLSFCVWVLLAFWKNTSPLELPKWYHLILVAGNAYLILTTVRWMPLILHPEEE